MYALAVAYPEGTQAYVMGAHAGLSLVYFVDALANVYMMVAVNAAVTIGLLSESLSVMRYGVLPGICVAYVVLFGTSNLGHVRDT